MSRRFPIMKPYKGSVTIYNRQKGELYMKKKKVLSLLMTAILTMSLAACGGKEPDAGSSGQSAAGNPDSSQAEGSQESPGGPLTPYDETVTLEVALMINSDLNYQEGDDITNNPWIRGYKEKLNIKVIPAFTAEWDDYFTNINLAIVDKNLPDVCMVQTTQLQQLIEADMLYDLSELYETYASDTIKSYMAMEPESFESGKSDGKLYGIAQLGVGPIAQINPVWIRKDWKDALGLEDPKTMEDLIAIEKAFQQEYGSTGIAADQTLTTLKILAPAWGAYPDIWIQEPGGQIGYGSIQPEMKTALGEWAKWYQEGLINNQFATTNTEKLNEDAVNGKLGIFPFKNWLGWTAGTDMISNLGREAYLEAYAVPPATSEKVLYPLNCDNYTYTVVSKNCKNPEAALKCINFFAYMENEAAEDGISQDEILSYFNVEHAAQIMRVQDPDLDRSTFQATAAAIAANDESMLKTRKQQQAYADIVNFTNDGSPTAVGGYMLWGPEKSAYSVADPIITAGDVIKNKVWAVTPDVITKAGSTLDDILTEGFTKIIMGEESLDYFDTLVEDWRTAGGDEATQAVNDMYGNQ